MKWIHRDERKPEDDTNIVFCTNCMRAGEGIYCKRDNDVMWADVCIKWEEIIGWMPTEQFPFAKEEDFE